MANQILTDDKINREALRILHENLTFTTSINTQYDSSFSTGGAKIGDSMRIRKPARYITRDGKALSTQDHRETNTQLTLTRQKGVDIEVSSSDLTLGLDDFSDKIVKPAMAQLASAIEADVLSVTQSIGQTVLTTGLTFEDVVTAQALMYNQTTPMDDQWNMMVDPLMQVNVVNELKGLFQDSKEISDQYKKGYMGVTGGYTWFQSARIPTQEILGSNAGDTATGDFTQGGDTLAVTALAGGLKAGQTFTVAGVFEIHPETKKVYPTLKKFVVAEDVAPAGTSIKYFAINDYSNADTVGAGESSTRLYPRGLEYGQKSYAVPVTITTNDDKFNAAQANQSTLVATGAALVFLGDTPGAGFLPQSVGFHKDAFTVGFADLVLPKGTDMAARHVYDNISMRMVRDFDISTDNFPMRFDVLYGYQTLRPEYACRIIEGT